MKHKLFTLLALAGTIVCGAFAFTACGETNDNNGNVGNNPSVDIGNNGGNNGNNGDVGGKDDNTENPPETHKHTLERHAAESATCTEGGNIEYWTCSGCKKNFSDKNGTTEVQTVTVSALGHDKQPHSAQAATCTAVGWDAYETCSRCDYTTYREIKALGHTEMIDEAVASTCIVKGKTEGKHCSVCSKVLVEQKELPLSKHIYNQMNACTVCGYEIVYTKGLAFKLSEDETYAIVTGIGTATSTSIVIPAVYQGVPVTSIGDRAFYNRSGLTSITIPDGVTSIGNYSFRDCSGLTSITIPDSVTSIGYDAFLNTAYYNDESNRENGVLYIGKHLIKARSDISGSYAIKEGTLTIANSAFYNRSGLTSITIPDSVTCIGEEAFNGCSGLTSITIPDSVTSIGGFVFLDCSGLTSITITDSVTSIGKQAFLNCSGLREIHYSGTMKEWQSIEKGSKWNYSTGKYTVHCTDGDLDKSGNVIE